MYQFYNSYIVQKSSITNKNNKNSSAFFIFLYINIYFFFKLLNIVLLICVS